MAPGRRPALTGLFALAFAVLPCSLQAQYFGRNKVQWEDFDFKTLRTEHFDIYYYPELEQHLELHQLLLDGRVGGELILHYALDLA